MRLIIALKNMINVIMAIYQSHDPYCVVRKDNCRDEHEAIADHLIQTTGLPNITLHYRVTVVIDYKVIIVIDYSLLLVKCLLVNDEE